MRCSRTSIVRVGHFGGSWDGWWSPRRRDAIAGRSGSIGWAAGRFDRGGAANGHRNSCSSRGDFVLGWDGGGSLAPHTSAIIDGATHKVSSDFGPATRGRGVGIGESHIGCWCGRLAATLWRGCGARLATATPGSRRSCSSPCHYCCRS